MFMHCRILCQKTSPTFPLLIFTSQVAIMSEGFTYFYLDNFASQEAVKDAKMSFKLVIDLLVEKVCTFILPLEPFGIYTPPTPCIPYDVQCHLPNLYCNMYICTYR